MLKLLQRLLDWYNVLIALLFLGLLFQIFALFMLIAS